MRDTASFSTFIREGARGGQGVGLSPLPPPYLPLPLPRLPPPLWSGARKNFLFPPPSLSSSPLPPPAPYSPSSPPPLPPPPSPSSPPSRPLSPSLLPCPPPNKGPARGPSTADHLILRGGPGTFGQDRLLIFITCSAGKFISG